MSLFAESTSSKCLRGKENDERKGERNDEGKKENVSLPSFKSSFLKFTYVIFIYTYICMFNYIIVNIL